jgi:hypothetical protein
MSKKEREIERGGRGGTSEQYRDKGDLCGEGGERMEQN